MRSATIVALVAVLVTISAARSLAAQPLVPDVPPGGEPARVVVNSQKSLAEAVGQGFRDETWEYPTELLPKEFAGLDFVSAPIDQGRDPKAAWRAPVALRDKTNAVEVAVNCYRLRDVHAKRVAPGTPTISLREPDYQYKSETFHGTRAAAALDGRQYVFVFREGDLLFKVEAAGGKPEARRTAAVTAAEAIWKFRHNE